MSANGIHIQTAGLRTKIRVDGWRDDGDPQGVRIYTTAELPTSVTPGTFTAPEGIALGQRGGHGGSEKGRILWALQWANFEPYSQVAALLLHLPRRPNRPLLVTRTMTAAELLDRDGNTVRARLLACAKQCAGELGRSGGALEWDVPRESARTLCQLYPFFKRIRDGGRGRVVLRWS
ncbi:MAG: hypothetical protein ACLP50_12155 [Solirubrobacteraceae bacterium]